MGPLAGKRIIEMGGIGPGPLAGMMFADMGAEVILVERKSTGKPPVGPVVDERFAIANRGKKSVALDLKQPGARDVVLRLLAGADGLIEGFRPGVMERLGLGPVHCLEANPALVYGRLTGWGQDGPLAQAAGHEINYMALAGALWHSGRGAAPPSAPPTMAGDFSAALLLVTGMLAAMLKAGETGSGDVVDAAISDGSVLSTTLLYGLFEAGYWRVERQQNVLDGGAYWYDAYECADGGFITLGALEPQFHELLLDKLGLADEPLFSDRDDRSRWPAQKARVGELIRTKSRQYWCDLLEGSDVCFAPVLDFAAAPRHPHNLARGTFTRVDGVTQPAPAPRFRDSPTGIAGPPPVCGEHADDVLAAAGYSEAELADLRDKGVL